MTVVHSNQERGGMSIGDFNPTKRVEGLEAPECNAIDNVKSFTGALADRFYDLACGSITESFCSIVDLVD